MAGHNKWAQIKHKKAITDAKKAKVFMMHAKTIAVESKRAKGDKNDPGLRAAMERARAANMPNDNIDRAIARSIGTGANTYEEVVYEAYGPGGVALLIEGITDNKNRTTPEIKHLLSEHGGNLGSQGSVLWAFKKNESGEWDPLSPLTLSTEDEEKLEKLLDALDDHDDIKNIYHTAAWLLVVLIRVMTV